MTIFLLFGCVEDFKRTKPFVGMCFETTNANPDILKIVSLKPNSYDDLFGKVKTTSIDVVVVKFGNRDEIIKNMKPFRIPYRSDGYKKVNCP